MTISEKIVGKLLGGIDAMIRSVCPETYEPDPDRSRRYARTDYSILALPKGSTATHVTIVVYVSNMFIGHDLGGSDLGFKLSIYSTGPTVVDCDFTICSVDKSGKYKGILTGHDLSYDIKSELEDDAWYLKGQIVSSVIKPYDPFDL